MSDQESRVSRTVKIRRELERTRPPRSHLSCGFAFCIIVCAGVCAGVGAGLGGGLVSYCVLQQVAVRDPFQVENQESTPQQSSYAEQRSPEFKPPRPSWPPEPILEVEIPEPGVDVDSRPRRDVPEPPEPYEPMEQLPVVSEYERHLELLRISKEIDLRSDPKFIRHIQSAITDARRQLNWRGDNVRPLAVHPILDLAYQREQLQGLPFRTVGASYAPQFQHARRAELSRRLAAVTFLQPDAPYDPNSPVVFLPFAETDAREFLRRMYPVGLPDSMATRDMDAATYSHVFEHRDLFTRRMLAPLLNRMESDEAIRRLVRIALFDLEPEIRDDAIHFLRTKPKEKVRASLLRGFRYPWAPIAQHAAAALITLDDRDAVDQLVALLDAPDPNAPFRTHFGWMEPALVRVNHLRSCYLCHAPSLEETDSPLRALVPIPGRPLPARFPVDSEAGNLEFIRFDFVYIEPDFSATHTLRNSGEWPKRQRFDYLIGVSDYIPGEHDRHAEQNANYPHREAVLFTLRKLTGRDCGDSTEAWRKAMRSGESPR